MKGSAFPKLLPAVIGLVGLAAGAAWLSRIEPGDWRPVRTTGERPPPAGGAAQADAASPWSAWAVRHETLAAAPPEPAAGLWPGFRGPDRDAVCKDAVPLADRWPAGGPRVLWRVGLGEGHAGAAVRDGRVYVMDYEPPPYLLLRDEEVFDWPELCRQLAGRGRQGGRTPHARVWELLGAEARALIEQGAGRDLTGPERAEVIAAMNEIIANRDFYRQDCFPQVKLTAYLRLSIRKDPILAVEAIDPSVPRQKVLRINRFVLERAFDKLILPHWRGDVVRCFALADGRELWRTSYQVSAKIEHGVSRAVPAVTEKHVVTLGPRCQAACFDAATGRPLWRRPYAVGPAGSPEPREFPYIDLVKEYGTKVPDWHASQCPLIDVQGDGREAAIFAPGGRALFVAIDCATGRTVWQTPTPPGWTRTMTHSSIVPMTFAGRRMYVYCFAEGVAAVAAEDGALLWSTTDWKNSVIAPSPLPLPEGRIFLTAGFGGGSVMLQLAQEQGRIVARKVFSRSEGELSCYQQTPVYYGGLVYLVNAAGRHMHNLACMDVEGQGLWNSSQRVAWGPLAVADGKMVLLEESGLLTVARVSAAGLEVLDQAKVLDGSKAWAPMAFAAGRVLVRNETEMVCLDLTAASP